jgi:hypothetical protein
LSRVTVYTRNSGTRKYTKASLKTFIGFKGKILDGSAFALRYTDAKGFCLDLVLRDGKGKIS